MTEIAHRPATIDDLLATDGKAELFGDRIVEFPMPGGRPSRVAFKIAFAFEVFARKAGLPGEVCADGRDFGVGPLRNRRRSFRPDASYYVGPDPVNPDGIMPGPPTLAIEVRSQEDHDAAAEVRIAAKIADYFEAGTSAVWDVDPVARTVTLHLREDPETPVVFRAGEAAHAGPAVPGWTMPVDSVFA